MVEGDGLENRCRACPTEGSNPSLSAIFTYLIPLQQVAIKNAKYLRPEDVIAAKKRDEKHLQEELTLICAR